MTWSVPATGLAGLSWPGTRRQSHKLAAIRSLRHYADLQARTLTVRSRASSSDIRPSQVDHHLPFASDETGRSNLSACLAFGRRSPTSGRHDKAAMSPITMAGQQAVDGNVLLQRFPVNAARTQLKLRALFLGGTQQAREPGQRDRHAPAVVQIDPHAVVVEAHRISVGADPNRQGKRNIEEAPLASYGAGRLDCWRSGWAPIDGFKYAYDNSLSYSFGISFRYPVGHPVAHDQKRCRPGVGALAASWAAYRCAADGPSRCEPADAVSGDSSGRLVDHVSGHR